MNVNKIFTSLQGEGPNSGIPMTFVRLQGCNLRCKWCDTKYSWSDESSVMLREQILETIGKRVEWICITGGEPLLQSDEVGKLVEYLAFGGSNMEMETNGTFERPFWADGLDTIMVDIKCPSSGQPFHNDKAFTSWLDGGNSVYHKFVVANADDLRFVKTLLPHPLLYNVIVSPAFKADNTLDVEWGKRVWDFCIEHKLRYSMQAHKILFGGRKDI
jgi:7-carboxy-7-deazaguanine synthase